MTPPVRPMTYEEWKRSQQTGAPREDGDRYGPVAGAIMSAADAATLGVGTTAGAGLSSIVRKIGGDERPIGDVFRSERDAVRGKLDDYRQEYPLASLGASVAGAVASPVSKVLTGLRPFQGAGVAARAGNAAAQGAVAGGVTGAVTADPGEIGSRALTGAAIGGGLGGAFSLAGDAIGQGARAIGLGPRRANDPGLVAGIRRRVGAETADDAGARRALRVIEREGTSLDDLAARSSAADDPDVLGEVIGNRGVRGLRTARMIGDKAPGQIDDALMDRAQEETARLRDTFSRLTGARPVDAKEIADEAMARVEPITSRLYQRVANVPAGDDGSFMAYQVVRSLQDDGIGVWTLARKLGGMPKELLDDTGNPVPLTLGQVQKLRIALDAMREDAELSADRIIQGRLADARADLDFVFKSGGGDAAAQQAAQLADELFANAKTLGESFAGGVRAAQTGMPATAARIVGEQGSPEMARAGVGTDVLRRLGLVVDEGGTQNPTPRLLGGDSRRQITRMAFPDDASFDQFREQAGNAGRRLSTFRAVSGGSQTADKLADALEFATDPSVYTSAASGNPFPVAQKIAQSGIVRRLVDANAQEADALTEYLLAGAPGQMTRAQAIQRLRQVAPEIQRRASAQTTRRGLAGAAFGGFANP